MNSKGISRRAVLGAAGAASLTVYSTFGTAPKALAAGSNTDITWEELSEVTFFTATFAKKVTWSVACLVQFEGLSDATNAELSVTVDNRIFGTNTALIVVSNGSSSRIEGASTTTNGARSMLSFPLSDSVIANAATTQFLLPMAASVIYPQDNIDKPVKPSVSLRYTDAHGEPQVIRRTLLESSLDENITAWGIEMSAAWDTVSTNSTGTRTYRCPTAVRIKSVGPADSPAGLSILVQADRRFSGTPTSAVLVSGSGNAISESSVGFTNRSVAGRRLFAFELSDAMAASSEATLRIQWGQQELSGTKGAYPSTVSFVPSGSRQNSQRVTGTEQLAEAPDGTEQVSGDIVRIGG